MGDPVRMRIRNGVGLAMLAAPAVLTAPVIAALGAAVARLCADPAVAAVVILSQGDRFATEAADVPSRPVAGDLEILCATVEGAGHPVIAGLPGPATGAGAALALAAHYRLAAPAATLAFPGVRLGLLPGGGAVQRLTRTAGAETALDLLLTGRPMAAAAAQAAGLVDGIVQGDVASGAFAYARALIDRGAPPRPAMARHDRLADPAAALVAVRAARGALGQPRFAAPTRLIDCVEAAFLLPADQALSYEAAAAQEALADPAGRAARHLLQAGARLPVRLAARAPGGRFALAPAGQAAVAALRGALVRAGQAIVRPGRPPAAVDAAAVALGLSAGPFGSRGAGPADPVLVHRLQAALVAEGLRLVDRGAVDAPGDVDVLAVAAMGFARDRGGPLFAAEAGGLARLVAPMADWAAEDPVWQPPPRLVHAALSGGGICGA